jgi:hypothetical protein
MSLWKLSKVAIFWQRKDPCFRRNRNANIKAFTFYHVSKVDYSRDDQTAFRTQTVGEL